MVYQCTFFQLLHFETGYQSECLNNRGREMNVPAKTKTIKRSRASRAVMEFSKLFFHKIRLRVKYFGSFRFSPRHLFGNSLISAIRRFRAEFRELVWNKNSCFSRITSRPPPFPFRILKIFSGFVYPERFARTRAFFSY